MNSNYGGWIGIPINYLYNSTRDIDRFNIKLRTESIDWSSDHGKLLEKSIVLTEDEKMFGILRSILELQNYNHIHTTLVPSATVFGLYVSAQTLNNRYNLFKLPQVVRFESNNYKKKQIFKCFQFILGPRTCVLLFSRFCVWSLLIHH